MLRKAYYLSKEFPNLRKSREDLQALQLMSLKRILEHAYASVPYYRGVFDRAEVLPGQISTLDDITRIPITTKDDLRSLPMCERLSSACSPGQLRMHSTGGTSGQPMEFCCDKCCDDLRSSVLYRMYIVNGYRPNDTIANLQFYPLQPNLLRRIGLLRRVAIPFDLPLDRQLEMLLAVKPQVLEGYPSRLSMLSAKTLERGIDTLRPRLIFTNSETLTENMKQSILSAFRVQPTNVYDSWEYGVVAWECTEHRGLHINADHFIVEVLRNGKVVDDGAEGELVITDLHNRAMPLIRYAIGDVAVKTTRLCNCGLTFPLIESVLGRTSEKIFLADGTAITVITQLFGIIEDCPAIREYQVVQNTAGSLDISIICDDTFTSGAQEHFRNRVVTAFKLDNVTIARVQSIERSKAGKRIPFLSNIEV
jgi:phenylacetate-CoA ligase